METTSLTHVNPESYRRSSPFVIVSYFFRGFAITSIERISSLLIRGSGGTVLALFAFGTLQSFDVHWFLRFFVICLCVLLVQLVISLFKYFTLRFRYDENKISAKKGIRTQKVQDFDWFNVRSIYLTRSAFQRRLNLASITLSTAGSSDNTIEIPYIPYSLALEWEQRVKDQELKTDDRETTDTMTASPSAEIGVSGEQQGELVHSLKLRKLVRASVANGNILRDAVIGFIVIGLGYCVYRFFHQILMLPPGVIDFEEDGPFGIFWSQVSLLLRNLSTNIVADTTSLFEAFQQFTGSTIAQTAQGKLGFFISLALILSVLSYLFSRIWYVVRHYGFVLTQRGIHLQVENGLMKKRRLTIRRDRVQTTSFRTNFVERSLNCGNVELDSVSKLNCRIPFVTTECADRIFRTVTDEENIPVTVSPFGQRFTPIHVLSFIQQLFIRVVFLLPIALTVVAIFVVETRGLIWPYSLLLIGYVVIRLFVGWRKKGYILNDDFLLQKEGGFSWWSVKISPLSKVQSMTIKQSWIQRLRDRATISFNFASGVQSIPFLARSVAESMQRRVEGGIRGERESPDQFATDDAAKEWKTLPQKYVVSRVIGKLVTSVLVLIPLFLLIAWGIHLWWSVSYELLGWILAPVFGAWVIWRVIAVCLKIPRYRYAFGSDDIVVKESFLATQTETVRFSRLQSVSTSNGLIDGFFGLCNLNLFTAESEVNVSGLDRDEAVKLREYIATRMLEISSTGTDALTMTEQDTSPVDSESNEHSDDTSIETIDSTHENNEIQWRKFSDWTREIVMRVLLIFLALPWILLMVALTVYGANELLVREFGESFFSVVFSFNFFLGIWLILSVWIGIGPFISIPRKGYAVSADALRYKAGWLYREHHFVGNYKPYLTKQSFYGIVTVYE